MKVLALVWWSFLCCFVGRREAGGSIGRHPSRNSGYLGVVTPVDSGVVVVVVVLAALDRRARPPAFSAPAVTMRDGGPLRGPYGAAGSVSGRKTR